MSFKKYYINIGLPLDHTYLVITTNVCPECLCNICTISAFSANKYCHEYDLDIGLNYLTIISTYHFSD